MGSLFDLALRLTCDLSSAIQGKCDFSNLMHRLVCQSMRDLASSLMFGVNLTEATFDRDAKIIWNEDLHVCPVWMPYNSLEFHEGDAMSSKKMGRRKFIKGASSAFIGLATAPLMNFNLSFAETNKQAAPQYPNSWKDWIKGDSRQHGSHELQRSGCATSRL